MKDLIQVMAQAIVTNPEMVVISELLGSHCTVVKLKVHKSEIGRVVGKQGRTAKALRTIVDAVSAKLKKRTVLEIMEVEETGGAPSQPVIARRQNGAAESPSALLRTHKRRVPQSVPVIRKTAAS